MNDLERLLWAWTALRFTSYGIQESLEIVSLFLVGKQERVKVGSEPIH